jgi:hypothetical protein
LVLISAGKTRSGEVVALVAAPNGVLLSGKSVEEYRDM